MQSCISASRRSATKSSTMYKTNTVGNIGELMRERRGYNTIQYNTRIISKLATVAVHKIDLIPFCILQLSGSFK